MGSKAYGLMRLAQRGLPVPPAFVLDTGVCAAFLKEPEGTLSLLDDLLKQGLAWLAEHTGQHFGDGKRPLLVSVRSGAPVSMPGMMDTILNIGLNESTRRGLTRLTGNPRLGFDCARRLVQEFAETAHGTGAQPFEDLLRSRLEAEGLTSVAALDTAGMRSLLPAYYDLFRRLTGVPFPADPFQQLRAAVAAVLRSWMSPRAESYRRLNGIPDLPGTAVIVQAMVFGNAGPSSGAGVGFTRSPADGSNALYADYLSNAQGEDVVSGRRNARGLEELASFAPEASAALFALKDALEQEFGDMQDFEFTVSAGRLYLLQARTGKRSPLAALRIARDMVAEGLMTPETALAKLEGIALDKLEVTELVPPAGAAPLGCGVPAGPGVAVGRAVFDPARLAEFTRSGEPAVLVRETTGTADVAALAEAAALVTACGARTSHAAVVARQLGKVCLVGCGNLHIEPSLRSARFGTAAIAEGDVLSVDGTQGLVYRGKGEIRRGKPEDLLSEVRRWQERTAAARQTQAAPRRRTPRTGKPSS